MPRISRRIENTLKRQSARLEKLDLQISKASTRFSNRTEEEVEYQQNDTIAVLVFTCRRHQAVREILRKLIEYRPNDHLFPIILSQDCDSPTVKEVADSFGDKIEYIKHLSGFKVKFDLPKGHKNLQVYYRISRHYKLGLEHVFEKKRHSHVIILEDDLDIAPDFFSYFSATRHLLSTPNSNLWCVSAWNDNGKPELVDANATALLHRSDFFPGLGWMMTRELWQELSPKWPQAFWDDWMREPEQRKDRQCIRPELGRTGMTKFGRVGASNGQFYKDHLIKIRMNTEFVKFSWKDLDYLMPKNYRRMLRKKINRATPMEIKDALIFLRSKREYGTSIRIMYDGKDSFVKHAQYLKAMTDMKAGVPRTAYEGIVTYFINGTRVYLVPSEGIL